MSYENIQTRNGRSRREKGGSLCMLVGGGGARLYQGATGVASRETALKHIDYTTKW